MRFANVLPIRCQNTIDISLQRDGNNFRTIGTNRRGSKSTSTTNLEIMLNVGVVNVFEFVGTRLECCRHAGEGVGIRGGGSDSNGGIVGGGWCCKASGR